MKDKEDPIVLIPGMWSGVGQLSGMSERFSREDFTVHELTHRKHGTDQDPSGLSFYDYLRDASSAIDAFGPCTVIGHSMGGLLAQKLANLNKNVSRVIMMNSAASKGICAMNRRILWRMVLSPVQYFALWTGKAFKIKDKDAKSLMLNNCPADVDPKEVFASMESGKVARQLAFSQIPVSPIGRCTSLVVCGHFDRMTPIEVQEKTVEKHGSAMINLASGHMPMFERCCEVMVLRIRDWIHEN